MPKSKSRARQKPPGFVFAAARPPKDRIRPKKYTSASTCHQLGHLMKTATEAEKTATDEKYHRLWPVLMVSLLY